MDDDDDGSWIGCMGEKSRREKFHSETERHEMKLPVVFHGGASKVGGPSLFVYTKILKILIM